MTTSLAQFIELPVIPEPRGALTFAEGGVHVPFDIARVYYLYDVPSGSVRAASISESAALQCEKLATAVGVLTVPREW